MPKSTSFSGRAGAAAAAVVVVLVVSLSWSHSHVHGDVAVEFERNDNVDCWPLPLLICLLIVSGHFKTLSTCVFQ